MLTYKNILIAVDGSHEAEWAFNKAVDVAKRNDAKLTIVNIIDSRTYSSYEVYDAQFTEKSKSFSEEEDILVTEDGCEILTHYDK